MKHLRYDWFLTSGRPVDIMQGLGITYQYVNLRSLADPVWFWNCENIPDKLPPYITELKISPHDAVGYGLSKEDADMIEAGSKK